MSTLALSELLGATVYDSTGAASGRVREVALSNREVHGIVLDCEGIDFIDSQGTAKMREILELTDQAGITLRLARLKPAVRERLARDGFLDRLGQDRIHGNVHRAVEAQVGEDPGAAHDPD